MSENNKFHYEDQESIPAEFFQLDELFHTYRKFGLKLVKVEAGTRREFKEWFLRNGPRLFIHPAFLLTLEGQPITIDEMFIRLMQLPDQPPMWRDYKNVGAVLLDWAGEREGDPLDRLFIESPYILGRLVVYSRQLTSRIVDQVGGNGILTESRITDCLFEGVDFKTDDLDVIILNSLEDPDINVIDFCRQAVSLKEGR